MSVRYSDKAHSEYKDYFTVLNEGFSVIDIRNYKITGRDIVEGLDQELLLNTPYLHDGRPVYAYCVCPIVRFDKDFGDKSVRVNEINTIEFYEDTRPSSMSHHKSISNYCPDGCKIVYSESLPNGFEISGSDELISYDNAEDVIREKGAVISFCEHVMSYEEYSDLLECNNAKLVKQYGSERAEPMQVSADLEGYDNYLKNEEEKIDNGAGVSDFVYVGDIQSKADILDRRLDIARFSLDSPDL